MSIAATARVHLTAILSAESEVADNVVIGPYAVLEGLVRLGPNCTIKPRVHLIGPLTMGRDNAIGTGTVMGERPQHFKYADEPTCVEIGDGNIFRENVTVHRGTTHSWKTQIGSHNVFMVGSHVAHDCKVGNRCRVANGALLGGHAVLEDNVYLCGNCAVHQFVRVGRLALLSDCSITTKDIPPFIMQEGMDMVTGVNTLGMRRAGMSTLQIEAVHKAFRIVFREGLVVPSALVKIEHDLGGIDVVAEFVQFIRESAKGRGINWMRDREVA